MPNYDDLAQKAHELRTTDELASVLWSFLASCDNMPSGLYFMRRAKSN